MIALPEKTALVTGASRGIGGATAIAPGKAGAQVLDHDGHCKAEAEAVVREIREAGGRADAVNADLAAPDGLRMLASHVGTIVGDRLGILVANAGISKSASIQALKRLAESGYRRCDGVPRLV